MKRSDIWKQDEAKYVKTCGKNVKGKKEYLRFLKGEYLPNSEAIAAHCYWCMNYYIDSRDNCGDVDCPLYNAILRIRHMKTK